MNRVIHRASALPFAALLIATLGLSPDAPAAAISLDVPVNEALGSAPTQLYYTMNTIVPGGTDTTPDSSGNGNTGNLHNGAQDVAPTSVAGKFDNAIYFAGSTEINEINPFLYASPSSSLNLTDMSFTTGMWLNFNSIRAGSYNVDLLSKGPRGVPSVGGYTFYLGKSSTEGRWGLYFETRDGETIGEVSTGLLDLNLQADNWYHFGLSFDHTTQQTLFYVNGTAVGSGTATVEIASSNSDYLNLNERGVGTWNSWFDGAYDDVFITEGVYTFSPVPEPSVIALLAAGLGAIFFCRRKRP